MKNKHERFINYLVYKCGGNHPLNLFNRWPQSHWTLSNVVCKISSIYKVNMNCGRKGILIACKSVTFSRAFVPNWMFLYIRFGISNQDQLFNYSILFKITFFIFTKISPTRQGEILMSKHECISRNLPTARNIGREKVFTLNGGEWWKIYIMMRKYINSYFGIPRMTNVFP